MVCNKTNKIYHFEIQELKLIYDCDDLGLSTPYFVGKICCHASLTEELSQLIGLKLEGVLQIVVLGKDGDLGSIDCDDLAL